jgi:hypothetical protein
MVTPFSSQPLTPALSPEYRGEGVNLVVGKWQINAEPTPYTMAPPPERMWQFLNFLPLPQGQGSLRPTR